MDWDEIYIVNVHTVDYHYNDIVGIREKDQYI